MRAHTVEDYADQYDQLMPVGLAWDRYRDHTLAKLLEAFAVEHARLEVRAINLVLYEFFPQTTVELLTEWETEWGLPDDCTPAGATVAERIEILLRKIRSLGGQSIQYFIDLAATMGIIITIEEFKPFRVGFGHAGDRVYGREWIHVFRVVAPATRIYRFRAGVSRAGERLRHWRRNEILECIINRVKPAHTYVMFGFEERDSFIDDDNQGRVFPSTPLAKNQVDGVFVQNGEGRVSLPPKVEPGTEGRTYYVDEKGRMRLKEKYEPL